MESKIGPIQPHPYGWKGDKRVNYTRDGKKHSCRISHEGLHLMLDDDWYTTKLLADLDPADANGKGKRAYVKDVLDSIDWENLDQYPNSATGVNIEELITSKVGGTECYHTKLRGVKKGGLKLIWKGDGSNGVSLSGVYDHEDGPLTPTEVVNDGGETLAVFDYETMSKRGFRLADWWVVPRANDQTEVHVVMAHISTF